MELFNNILIAIVSLAGMLNGVTTILFGNSLAAELFSNPIANEIVKYILGLLGLGVLYLFKEPIIDGVKSIMDYIFNRISAKIIGG